MLVTPVAARDSCGLRSERQPSGACLQEPCPSSCLMQDPNALERSSAEVCGSPMHGSTPVRDPMHGANCVTALPGPDNAFPIESSDAVKNATASNNHSGASSPSTGSGTGYEHVLGIVNPISGESRVAQYVLRSMRELLGADRVILLDAPLFANPAPLIEAIRNYAVRFIRQGSNGTPLASGTEGGSGNATACSRANGSELERRGTVFVCGGDGTVAFVMEQLDVVYEMIKSAEMTSRGAEAVRDAGVGMGGLRLRVLLPAVAVLALGTGNDYSNCMGFGSGYLRHKLSGLCCCMENAIEPFVRHAVTAPAIPFDRWTARLVPLTAIWQQQENQQQRQPPPPKSGAKEYEVYSPVSSLRGDVEATAEHKEGGKEEEEAAAAAVTANSVDVDALDWDALDAAGACMKYNFINYFSVGFDAYVAQKFDAFRRRHLKFCSTRMHNKLVYATYGLKAVFRCSTLRPCIPSVCVPQLTRSASSGVDASQGPSGQSEEKTSMVNLSLPKGSKALLVTNISSYAAGTRPWKEGKGHLYRDDPGTHPMVITPVCVNDRKMEVQALGGLFQMGLLQLGIGKGASKLAQTRELLLFVLCKSTDISRRPQLQKGGGATAGKLGGERDTPLCLQIDGEAIGRITQPTVVYITELHRPRVYVRCRNPSVVRSPIQDEDLLL
ncbi:putative diacylglycerol kinase [Trypanosoma conorhini]|uniref:diacylglycerol kinase (ATP) n=1 Tax=Trypanosoma conorhini TaxID=83891 RepID=A0A3R7N957_9TRYP|nr:putative diacylglycerol kinase [Trypanosoma conorhini]RNF27479.1 putative diacylglycerol kinase [Trypanosoma conorhini]